MTTSRLREIETRWIRSWVRAGLVFRTTIRFTNLSASELGALLGLLFILLHKIAYDYVTLFNVYECAISQPLLEQRIREAEEIIMGRYFANYLTERLAGVQASVTRLSHGVPVGGELELLDDGTLLAALTSRRPF